MNSKEIKEKINQCKGEELLIRQKIKMLKEELKRAKKPVFYAGDVVVDRHRHRRLIVCIDPTTLIPIDAYGYQRGPSMPIKEDGQGGSAFEGCDYRKIGALMGFRIVESTNQQLNNSTNQSKSNRKG